MQLFFQAQSISNACVTIRGHLPGIIQLKAQESLECIESLRGNEANISQGTCYKRMFLLSSKGTYVMLEQLEDSSAHKKSDKVGTEPVTYLKGASCQCIHLTNAARVANIL